MSASGLNIAPIFKTSWNQIKWNHDTTTDLCAKKGPHCSRQELNAECWEVSQLWRYLSMATIAQLKKRLLWKYGKTQGTWWSSLCLACLTLDSWVFLTPCKVRADKGAIDCNMQLRSDLNKSDQWMMHQWLNGGDVDHWQMQWTRH